MNTAFNNSSFVSESTALRPAEALGAQQDSPLFQAALQAIAVLENAGYEGFIVGGFVRDALLGRPVHDADLASNAPYETLLSLFRSEGYSVISTGEAHGTATVIINNLRLEITRYRTDGTYADHRHPEQVTFVQSLEEDLARRDFTINAMAFNPRQGIIDPYEGRVDLAQKRIRCVGNAHERFREDALRILRALRFASQLEFTLDHKTACAIHECAPLLKAIAIERIYSEFTLLLCGRAPYPVLMEYSDVVFLLIPELAPSWKFDQHTPYHIYDVYDHLAHCVAAINNTPLDRWVALLHDVGKPAAYAPDKTGQGHFPKHAQISCELSRVIAHRFKMPRAFSHDMLLLIARHDDVVEETPRAVKRMLRKLDEKPELFLHLCAMKRADTLSQAPCCCERLTTIDHLENIVKQVLEEQAAFSLRDLCISGRDLLDAGYVPSPAFKTVLSAALNAVIDEQVENNKQSVWSYLEEKGYLKQLTKA